MVRTVSAPPSIVRMHAALAQSCTPGPVEFKLLSHRPVGHFTRHGSSRRGEKHIRALLISAKGACSPKELYQDVVGESMPYQEQLFEDAQGAELYLKKLFSFTGLVSSRWRLSCGSTAQIEVGDDKGSRHFPLLTFFV